ncbi:non-ribosomal peptide synthetase [Streptomyces sp. TRM70350]|uniref:non-ribosomal peptide synthetase n=1 Tax=Streptomyces sp. TRM70350 TaxID=2856165 RepID=UPI001C44C6F1|nr:non-ribosomal peptide synthetase [Streptomyces sp. TRM70350]MBV7697787.1 amino acid adenylation domain-containing protein [Streptomyces sp. TRM70350]
MAETATEAPSDSWRTGSPSDRRATEAPSDGCPTESLSPIQRAYLVGDQEGLELRGPARYYLACDLDPARVPGMDDRLERLVRANGILRMSASADLSLTVLPEDAARRTGVEVRRVSDAEFDAANDSQRRTFTSDAFAFAGWPQFQVVVVASEHRARLHLCYALWLMDAASLDLFLAGLVADRGTTGIEGTAGTPETQAAVRAPARAGRRDRSARDRRFWRERAATLADAAELPLRPNWRQVGPGVSHRTVTVEAAVAERVAKTAREHGLTPPMVYLAAYGALLGRIGGQVAHTLTVLYSRRVHPLTYDTLGNDGTTMPLEVPASTGRSFLEIARTVQSRFLGQAVHGSLGGAEIARLGDPGADPRRLPYPLTFTALEADGAGEGALGLRRRWDDVQLRVPQVLLDHQVFLESDGRVRLGFDWRTDAFDAGFVEDFADQYTAFVLELAADDERWTRVPGRTTDTPPVRQQAPAAPRSVPGLADGMVGGTAGGTLHERVLLRAADTPEAPAVHDAHGSLTYGELVTHASALADLLLATGARAGDRVAVQLPRGRGQVVAVLGSLLAGCVYIPLDHGTPDGRLDSIARRGGVRFAVTEGRQAADDRWRDRGVTPLPLPAPDPGARVARSGDGGDTTAYIIFTSGSTGEPKGVVISHPAVLNTIDAVNDRLGLGPDDRVLSVSSLGFDLSVYDVFGPLLCGGSVVMLSEETARNPAAWTELIAAHGVTVWNSAPALASLLAEEQTATPTVRAFLLSGDWIPLTLPAALGRLAPEAEVISLGGATEGSIWSIWHRIDEADRTGRSIPYGKAMPGQEILVLDADGRECPDWHIGEIHIAGAGVADGYASDPEKTRAAFLDDPVFGRMYRTGDRGRRQPGGVVEFLGRTDTQVKLNGHRVELGEIEHVLQHAPGVLRCAVSVRGEARRKRLVGCVTLVADAPVTWRQDAHAALRDALPQYMVPDALIELDSIPLTSNGKVDRRRLETLPLDEATATDTPAPRALDLHGREVALCWREVLGEPPGPESFFEAGGGSYDAIRLLSLLRGRFGYDVPFGAFMADPTVTGLAALCRGARTSGSRGVWTYRPRASGTPGIRLVLFPPVGGGVSCYHGLIRALTGDVDVHVIGFDGPLRDMRGEASGGTSVEVPGRVPGRTSAEVPGETPGERPTLAALARRCLEQLPAGSLSDGVPHVFAGWSFGGALAFEAARICGTPVRRVVVVDTPVSAAARGSGDEPFEPSLDGFLRDVRETSGVQVEAEEAATDPALRGRFEVYRQNMTLLRDWEPTPAPVPVVEFRAVDGPAEPDAGAWSGVACVEASAPLTGGHFDVFEGDNVRQVTDAIEEAETR